MTFRTEEVARALLAKGFREVSGRRHRKFVLYHQGKQTMIRTELSYGSKNIGGDLLSAIKRQLHLDSLEQLSEFIKCPMEYADYIAHLQSKGVQL